jgi:Ca2+/Na+ antiporter
VLGRHRAAGDHDPLVAIIASSGIEGAADHIGVSAVWAPFMLSTLAMFVTGIGVLAFRKRRANGSEMKVDTHVLSTDIRYFFVAYSIAIAAALVPADMSYLRYGAVVALLGVYAWYVKSHFEADPSVDAVDDPVAFRRSTCATTGRASDTRLRIVSLQVLVALAMIVGGAVIFVDAVEHIAHDLRLPQSSSRSSWRPSQPSWPEVQQHHLGARGMTHGDGQHHRRHGLQSCILTIIAHPGLEAWSRPTPRRSATAPFGTHRVRLDDRDLPADGTAWLAERQTPVGRRPVLRRFPEPGHRSPCRPVLGRALVSQPAPI